MAVSTASAVSPLQNRRAGPSRCARRRCERERHRPLQVTVSPAPRELSDRIRGWRERTAVGSAGLSCPFFFLPTGRGRAKKDGDARATGERETDAQRSALRVPAHRRAGPAGSTGLLAPARRLVARSRCGGTGDVDKQGYSLQVQETAARLSTGFVAAIVWACYTLVTTTTTTADAALQFAATCKTVLLAGKKKTCPERTCGT